MYSLWSEDGRGDSGTVSTALHLLDNEVVYDSDSEPCVGKSMRVGSAYARSYQWQDYWTTTPVKEILSRVEDENGITVVFKTRSGSIYTWRKY